MMPSPGRHRIAPARILVALGAFAAAAVPAGPLGGAVAPAATTGAPDTTPVLLRGTVDHRTRKLPTARHFIGLSLEYKYLGGLGNASTGGNPVLARLFQNITDAGNGAPVLRLGGGSQDQAWWNPDGKPKPIGINWDLTPASVDALQLFESQSHLPLIVGLNMASGGGDHEVYPSNPARIAVDWARAALKGLGRDAITAFEVGNEPDLYAVRGYDGQPQPRPSGWAFSDYLGEADNFYQRLKQVRSWLPLAGPGACCDRAWDQRLPEFLQRVGDRTSLVTTHNYLVCKYEDVAMSDQLSDWLMARFNARLDPVVRAARQAGKPLRLTETATNGCRGDARFGYALWATDWLMDLSKRFVGADFHLIGGSPFNVYYDDNAADPHWEASVTPLYYAMVLAARAIRSGSSVLPDATLKEQRENGSNTRIWATLDRQGTIRVVALNKGGDSGQFVLRVPGGGRPGELQRLTGEDPSLSTGVTLAGQAVAPSSRTGLLVGPKLVESVDPAPGAVYSFTMPRYSAALLTIHGVG